MFRLVFAACLLLLARPVSAIQEPRAGAGEAAAGEARGAAEVPAARSVSALRAMVDRMLQSRERDGQQWSVLAVSLDRGDTLYAHAPDRVLAPASNMKLLTTAAALIHLGPDYRFQTYLFVDGPVVDSVLEGNVYLYGTGDPTLGARFEPGPAAVLRAFADTLAALGIREIRGDVVGDGSYFQGPATGEGWNQTYMNAWYAPTAGALTVHENLVRLDVLPAKGSRVRPEVRYTPGGRGIAVVSLARTGGRGVRVSRLAYNGPILIEGGATRDTLSFAVPVADPARFAAAVFRDVIESREIVVHGRARAIENAGESPVTGRSVFAPAFETEPLRVVALHTSGPLSEILGVINHESHNLYAEQVLRVVGRVATGDGSIDGGARAIRALLASAGADTSELRVADGCGLSALNRASASTFVRLLAYMDASALAQEFRRTLPAAGHARRFRRMAGTPAEGNLRAKTGTINGVSSLSGYVTGANGERLAFSIISNGVGSTGVSKDIENRIGVSLAQLDRGGADGR